MDDKISAADANRKFSALLRGVREGRSYVITSHGKPVAKIVPVEDEAAKREAAWQELIKRLKSQPAMDMGPWTREELYDRSKK